MISFIIFSSFTLVSICTNTLYYLLKKRKYSLNRIKIFIIIILTTTTIFLIINIPFFFNDNPDLSIDKNTTYFIPTILFNLSNIIYSVSIVLFLLTYLQYNDNLIDLEIPKQIKNKKGNILIGKILKGRAKQKFYLALKDLEKHMFICGATGTGKSNFLKNFLINFKKSYNIPFFLVEFKGEYHILQRRIEEVLILWPGRNFSINIFNPGKVNPIIHAERIFDILKSGKFLDDDFEYSPQMEKVLVEILVKVCKSKEFLNWKGFEYFCKDYLNKNKNNIPMLTQTLISIKNRIRRFSIGPLRALFEGKNEINVEDIFQKNIVLDLSSIISLGGEKEDALFFLNMILKYLWDRNLTKGAFNFKGIQHITIIEDAQYFAPQDLMKRGKLTTYLEDIALLQRGTGECLVTLATRPNISKEILANNGVVLTFKNHFEKDIMCELLNIEPDKKHFLSILEEGQCIIRANSIKEPFLLSIPLIKNESIPLLEIKKKNKEILNKSEKTFNDEFNIINDKSDHYPPNVNNKLAIYLTDKVMKGSINSKNTKKNLNSNAILLDNNFKMKETMKEPEIKYNSYDELKMYINRLYKLQKKKE
ncbi:MAG: ATP-binding protein [Candidatus Thorarchaeota archaeon]